MKTDRPRKTVIVLLVLIAASCARVDESLILKPGERPGLDSTEGGLWALMEKEEKATRNSGRRVEDERLNAYIENVVCTLAPGYCADIRVYVLDSPVFNAAMYPNGMMHVYTGLLLRMQNEAQLAAVLGHELTHYVQRHSLKRFIDIKNKADALTLFSVAIHTVGIPGLDAVAGLGTLASIMAYSRDHEREADAGGLKLLAGAGYSPGSAPEIWENLVKEQKAGDKGNVSLFFATHPSSEERVENLRRQAGEIQTPDATRIGEEDFSRAVMPLRAEWFRQELALRQFAQSEIVLRNLPPSKTHPGELHFMKGEMIRLQGEKDYILRSSEHYQKAIDLDKTDPRPRKAIGLMLMKTGQTARAREHLETYIRLQPDAEDASVIRGYVMNLR